MRPERRQQKPLAELAARGPLLGRPDEAQHLDRDAVLAQRLDPLDVRRLHDAPPPLGIRSHRGADVDFIELCAREEAPLLFLQNITGFMVGRRAEPAASPRTARSW